MKTATYKLVLIKWIDSTMRKSVWWGFQELDESIKLSEREDYFYTTGYLFKETKKNYYLCNSIHFEENKPISFGQIFSIPKGFTTKITYIK